jgi:hypothetical protein
LNKKQLKYEGPKKKAKTIPLDLTARNYQLFGLGILVLVIGYVFLSKAPVNGFWSLTFAPILLVIGYCIVMPFAVLYRNKNKESIKNINKGD